MEVLIVELLISQEGEFSKFKSTLNFIHPVDKVFTLSKLIAISGWLYEAYGTARKEENRNGIKVL
jgi:hypothetical protein